MAQSKRGLNKDQLRADIDAGRTGDKVDFLDPAAAPLGTDAEAGGTPTPQVSKVSAPQRDRLSPWMIAVPLALVAGLILAITLLGLSAR